MGARPLFFKPLTGENKTMKIFTNHRYALITGIVLAVILSVLISQASGGVAFRAPSFARWLQVKKNRRDEFYIHPAGGVDLCNALVPVRAAK